MLTFPILDPGKGSMTIPRKTKKTKRPLTPEQELAKKIIAMYPELDAAHPTSYVLFTNDFTSIKETLKYVCHAPMVYAAKGFDRLITAVPNKSDAALLYLRWLIIGPFHRWAKYLEIKKLGSDYYILINDLRNVPANVAYNFCIATRVPIEWPGVLANWYTLIGAGCPPSLAFLCAMRVDMPLRIVDSQVDKNQDSKNPLQWELKFLLPLTGHFWLDPTSDWYLVLAGEPDPAKLSPPYKERPDKSRPCNLIWGFGSKTLSTDLTHKTVAEVMAFFSTPEVVSEPEPDLFVSQPGADDALIIDEDFDDDEIFLEFEEDEAEDEDFDTDWF